MVAKQRITPCGPKTCALLCETIRRYAQAAFPPGGSECAQASRESLLEIAARIEREHPVLGGVAVKGRQRGMLQGAVKAYFGELTELPDELATTRQVALLSLLQGEALPDDRLFGAGQRDG